ncbi:MAG: 5-carboxymethyl-2-hydroxymuconate semialdehyde dehydrogenase [Rhodospirillaceae bacterium]|nr:5-carboxymethyl-2-hydroxymuconate semialdehyde dehydrogenase [Rhodospirillaceae bacterium]
MTDMLHEHLKKLEPYKQRICAGILPHHIGGAPDPGSSALTFENLTPVDNSKLCDVARGTAADIDRAATAAEAAFTDWRKASGKARKQVLHKIADLIVARREEIALLECLDTGQTIRFMKAAAERSAANYRYFADRASEAADGLALPAEEHLNYTTRQPIGPVGVITPWNTPFMLSTWKIAPALASGCTVVHKPAEWSPLTATILAEISEEAGLPDGAHNLVHGMGEDAGVALTEHVAIRAVAFVGESATGSKIMAQGAPTLKRVHFELGGKNPVIVFEDADLDRALDAAVFMIYSLNGERCTSSSRLLVQRSIHDAFVEKLAARVRNIRVGHPLDPETEVGPLIHPVHFDKVMGYMDVAKADGATVAAGGARSAYSSGGNFVSATLFTGARTDMRIAQEEIFGPVLTVIPFEDEDEAVRIGNDVRYGLAGYLWTGDVGRAHRVAQALDAGMIWVNSQNVRHLPSPFGGTKASGIGRDGGDYSFDFYMETKNICIALGDHRIPQMGA